MIAVWVAASFLPTFLSGCADGGHDWVAPKKEEATMSMSPSPLGHYLSARLAQDEMDSGRAVNFYDVALSANPDNQALLHQTMLLMLAEGRIADAISLAQRRIARHSDAAMARLILASQAIRDNDLATARKHLSKTKRKKFMSLLQPLLLAWINSADDRYGEALTALNHLRKRKAFKPFRTYHSALISDFSGYDAAARESFEETLKGNAWRASRVSLNYGGFLSRQGQRDDALALFNKFLERNPNNPVIDTALRKLKAGGTLWPPITTAAQGVAEAFLSAGYAFSGSLGVETARIYSQLALYLRPDLDPARMLLAEMFESEQRYKDAIDVYKEVRASSPLHWSARIRIASNMSSLERVDESITLLRSMAAEKPKDTTALIIVARVLRAQERFEETIATYNKVFERIYVQNDELQKHHWVLLYERGVAYERAKQWDAAEADFLKALELRPNEPRVLNYLGYSWIDRGVNLERARTMIEKAVSKRPEDGYVVDSLGWVFYRLGRYEEAVKYLERAVELRPQDPIINDHLGDAYWRAGRKLEARFQWNHAIDLGAEEKMIPDIRAKQANGLGPIQPLSQERDGKSNSGG